MSENERFKSAVEKFAREQEGRPYLTDKLEGFSSGWIAYRESAPDSLLPLVKELREALRQTEWGDKSCVLGDLHCPVCGRPDMAKHKEDCSVGIALARADKALEERKR